jgi:tRNA 2-thiouridine synthesizing protein D
MAKTLTLFLASTPYSGQDAYTALRLAEAALARGHAVHLFASADGVYLADGGQRPVGVPDLPTVFGSLIEHGLQADLCGSCLGLRGLGRDRLIGGAEPSSLKGLFAAIDASDAVLSLGG